jgi:hypothetical protein
MIARISAGQAGLEPSRCRARGRCHRGGRELVGDEDACGIRRPFSSAPRLDECPGEQGQQRLDVGGLGRSRRRPRCAGLAAHRGSSRHQARRLFLPASPRGTSRRPPGRPRRARRTRGRRCEADGGGERVAGSPARKSTQSVRATHSATAARLASVRAISPGRPPMDSAQRRPSSASSTQSMEGVLMVSPAKMPSMSLPPFVRRRFSAGAGRS